jgi:hypothetical protein
MTLQEAIAAVEAADTTRSAADTAKANADTKLAAAQAASVASNTADADAITAFNKSLDDLVTAATAAKIPVTPPTT